MSLFVHQMNTETTSNDAVVLLHGLFGQSSNLSRLAKQLSAQHRVLLVDLPGHGDSAAAPFHDLSTMAESVANGVFDAMREQGIERVSLFGHSLGGKVAMQIADRYPDMVTRLIVADIAPVAYAPSHLRIIDGLLKVSHSQVDSRRQADEVLQEFVDALGVRQFLLKNLAKQETGEWGWKFDVARLAQYYDELINAPQLSGVFSGDALFLKAERSDYITEDHRRTIDSFYPHAQYVTIFDAGHWLHAEQPDAVFEAVQCVLK
ncbi:MAG: alpha/beta fold hydrolase [Pseudomonadota bacterium]